MLPHTASPTTSAHNNQPYAGWLTVVGQRLDKLVPVLAAGLGATTADFDTHDFHCDTTLAVLRGTLSEAQCGRMVKLARTTRLILDAYNWEDSSLFARDAHGVIVHCEHHRKLARRLNQNVLMTVPPLLTGRGQRHNSDQRAATRQAWRVGWHGDDFAVGFYDAAESILALRQKDVDVSLVAAARWPRDIVDMIAANKVYKKAITLTDALPPCDLLCFNSAGDEQDAAAADLLGRGTPALATLQQRYDCIRPHTFAIDEPGRGCILKGIRTMLIDSALYADRTAAALAYSELAAAAVVNYLAFI